MANDLVKNCKGLSGLSACKCSCSENLLTAKRSTGVTWDTLNYGCCLCRCEKFLVVSYLFVPISCFKLVFLLKAIMSCELLNISIKLLSLFNICQCLFIISFIFESTELYVTENCIESLRLGLQLFKCNDLYKLSTPSICFLTVDSLQPFSRC